jgi:hypothetical protein
MAGRAPGYQDILTSLLTEGDTEKAISLTLARNENAYSFFRYCRRKIIGDDNNREPFYLQRVRHFQHVHFSPQDPEWEQLNALMESSLRDQHRVETSRKPFFRRRPDLDPALRQIKCLPQAVYEYKLPAEYSERAIERQNERREELHCNPVNISDIQTILCKAKTWREFTHPWELVACASILCGRRTQEIIWAMDYEKVSDRIIHVRGLMKQAVGEGDVPILVGYDEFHELIQKIRETELPTESTTHRLKPAFLRVFGEWFNHTQRRNIYCEAAFRFREESGFFTHYPKMMWCDKALCHDSNVVHRAGNLSYQALTFHEDERDSE